MTTGLRCELHGVGLAVETDREDWLACARTYLSPLAAPPLLAPPLLAPSRAPSIHVTLEWGKSLPAADLEPLGRRVWIGQNCLRLSEIRLVPGLQIQLGWEGDTLRVHAAFRWPGRGARWLAALVPAARTRLYISLVYYLVYFPWGWWLERERGWSLLHAAGLRREDGGVILSGLPGCGKSTLVWAALSLPGWQLLSDNLLFADGRQIYACPEPLHVDARARALIESTPGGVQDTGRAFSHQREDFELLPERRATQAQVDRVIFLRRGRTGGIQPLDHEAAFRRLWVGDMLAQEWAAYEECAAAICHLVPQVGDPARRWANLERLAALPCCQVVVPDGEMLSDSVREILDSK